MHIHAVNCQMTVFDVICFDAESSHCLYRPCELSASKQGPTIVKTTSWINLWMCM